MVPRSAEECRVVPSSAGKGWGRHWGAFKLLYYRCNTTKIDRVEQPRTVCGAEECRGVLLGTTNRPRLLHPVYFSGIAMVVE